jgi:hypothetical protein
MLDLPGCSNEAKSIDLGTVGKVLRKADLEGKVGGEGGVDSEWFEEVAGGGWGGGGFEGRVRWGEVGSELLMGVGEEGAGGGEGNYQVGVNLRNVIGELAGDAG